MSGQPPAEVVVVDNHPSGSAATVVAAMAAHLPVVHVVEPTTGLSRARNTGAATATGDYLVFLDDDAVCPPGYVARVVSLVAQWSPDLFGGPVEPLFEIPPPAWFPLEYELRRHAATSGFSLTAKLSGANFGIASAVFARLGGFDPTLGMVGTAMRFHEETALLHRYRAPVPLTEQRVCQKSVGVGRIRWGCQGRRTGLRLTTETPNLIWNDPVKPARWSPRALFISAFFLVFLFDTRENAASVVAESAAATVDHSDIRGGCPDRC